MAEDRELELLKTRKLLELTKKMGKAKKEASPREILASRLVDRGLEVLEAAERQYPKATEGLVNYLAKLIQQGGLEGDVSGGDLLWFFRRLGLDVRIETKLVVEEKGRLVPVAEKLRADEG